MRVRVSRCIAVGVVAVLLSWPAAASAGGVIPKCIEILKEYVGKPAVKGASEALGAYLTNMLLDKAAAAPVSPDASPQAMPMVPTPEQLTPTAELSMSYFDYLQSLGLSECEIRSAMERTFGPPSAKRYNPD
jgi:hypothetical protein